MYDFNVQDERIWGRPWGWGGRPWGWGFRPWWGHRPFFGGPFLGGFLGGFLGSTLTPPFYGSPYYGYPFYY